MRVQSNQYPSTLGYAGTGKDIEKGEGISSLFLDKDEDKKKPKFEVRNEDGYIRKYVVKPNGDKILIMETKKEEQTAGSVEHQSGDLNDIAQDTLMQQLSSTYDVRNASFGEIEKISYALYTAGKISLKEHAILTFDHERAANNLKQNAPFAISTDFEMHETSTWGNGKRDWIAVYEARASRDFKYGNLIGHQSNMKILSILKELESK